MREKLNGRLLSGDALYVGELLFAEFAYAILINRDIIKYNLNQQMLDYSEEEKNQNIAL